MSNQDIEGNAPAAPPGTPEYFEQQLTKEREARALMRDRLRHTEALAAESHALRARMAEELERVTADRNRLRTAAETAAPATPDLAATTPLPFAPPPMTPHAADWPLKPPAPPRRSGPWRALAMLGGLAVAVAALAWLTGTLPGLPDTGLRTAHEAPVPTATPAPPVAPPAPSTRVATAAPEPAAVPSGVVALPPLTPEAELAAAPTAAGPAPVTSPAPAGMDARLRKALDGEGIEAPVEVDAATGHVVVADPKADSALRERTDMLIRAVYAGASVPEPQIEHRWMSPMRAATAATATPTPPAADATPAPAPPAATTAAQAYAARHAAQAHAADRQGAKATAATVADAEELRPVLPEGRVTANCRASLAGRTPHRADMTACMKTSCCRTGAGQSEECRAYQKAYPFTCSAG